MRRVDTMYLMIHPLTYIDHEQEYRDKDFFRLALECENRVAERWHEKISEMRDSDILVLLPSRPEARSMRALEEFATEHVGERCIVVNRSKSDWRFQEFWDAMPGPPYEFLGKEIRDALVGRRSLGSLDEVTTGVQAYSYVQELKAELKRLDMIIDPDSVRAEAWGESFEGCVAKYAQMMGNYLGLEQPVEVSFDLTVPDARFLLNGTLVEQVPLVGGVRLYLFKGGDDVAIGTFFEAFRSPSGAPRRVSVAVDPSRVRVLSTTGEEAQLPDDPELHVRFADGFLQAPLVWTGYPCACFIAGTGYSCDEFRNVMINASVMGNG